jgi:radical SAM protein with 4Fe4S-binding SPASM domain
MIKRVDTTHLFKSTLTNQQNENSLKNIEEGNQGVQEMSSYPRRIVVELTNRCNLNCIMCGRTGRHFEKFNFDREWFKVLEPAFVHTEEIVLHGWGEPLVYKGFSDLLEYLDQFPMRKYFCTNGMLLKNFKEDIFKYHVDILAISMDGAKKATNDRIRAGGNQKLILDNVREIVQYKKEHNLDYPHMNFVFTAMTDNIDELPDMIDLAASIGIPEVKVVYLTAFDEDMAKLSLYNKQELVKKNFLLAEKKANEKGIQLKMPYMQGVDPAGTALHRQCFFPFRDLFIGSDGFVRPCMSITERMFSLDSVQTFNEAWNHDKMRDLRKNMTEECNKCYHSSCANWNNKESFIQIDELLLPDWNDEASFIPNVEVLVPEWEN